MSAALVIPCEDNYWPGAQTVIRTFDDHTTYKHDVVIISRTVKQAPGLIVVPQTAQGDTEMPWLTDSFTWFEALKLPYQTLIIMDADQIVVGDVDPLFELPTGMHMAPAIMDKYCTGLVVIEGGTIEERMSLYEELTEMVALHRWHFGDQSLINKYITDNDINIGMLPRRHQHLKAYGEKELKDACIVHFHGMPKPWDTANGIPDKLYQLWEEAQS